MSFQENITVKQAIAAKIPIKGKIAIVTRTVESFYYSNLEAILSNERPWAIKAIGQRVVVHIGSVVMVLEQDDRFKSRTGNDCKVMYNGRICFLPSTEMKITKIEDIFNGKTFCITGSLSKPREFYKTFIHMKGGKFKPSLSKKVDYLIVGEQTVISRLSTKQLKAEAFGVPIITENQFFNLFDQKDRHVQRPGAKL